jgi:hypothetical protein
VCLFKSMRGTLLALPSGYDAYDSDVTGPLLVKIELLTMGPW